MFSNWVSFETTLEDITKEAGFIAGYRKSVEWATDPGTDVHEEGMRIVKKAHNIRQYAYKQRDLRMLAYKRRAEAETAGDLKAFKQYDKEITDAENAIWIFGLDLLRLRGPLEIFLYDSEIPERVRPWEVTSEDD